MCLESGNRPAGQGRFLTRILAQYPVVLDLATYVSLNKWFGVSNLTNMSNHQAIIRAFYEGIWNKHDKSQIPELLHEDFSFRGSLGQERHGHAGFAAYVDFVHTALSDYRCEIQEMIAEGNKAFARLLFSGMHRAEFFGYQPTGKRVEWVGAAVFTFAGEKISALWVLGDIHGLLQQLANNARP